MGINKYGIQWGRLDQFNCLFEKRCPLYKVFLVLFVFLEQNDVDEDSTVLWVKTYTITTISWSNWDFTD